jgi:hypothetical protein
MRRQIFVAAASSGDAPPNASTTTQPSSSISCSPANVSSPVHLPAARRRAVVLREVHVDEHVLALVERGARILLLDMRVEGVVHHPHARMIDLTDERREIRGGIREVHLESAQILERDRHVALLRVRRHPRTPRRARRDPPRSGSRRRSGRQRRAAPDRDRRGARQAPRTCRPRGLRSGPRRLRSRPPSASRRSRHTRRPRRRRPVAACSCRASLRHRKPGLT